jgi:putative Holliday junction resolvase
MPESGSGLGDGVSIARKSALQLNLVKASSALTIESLAESLQPRGRLIGLDLGTKTIGVALSDVERRFASPLRTITRGKFSDDANSLVADINKYEIKALILGLPLLLSGEQGARAQSARAFVRNFAALDRTPIVLWDERFSTAAVERALVDNDVSRAKRLEVIDQMAASYILQGALDRLRSLQQG